MKRPIMLALVFLLATIPAFGRSHHTHSSARTTSCCARSSSDEHVPGYTRKNGTRVQPYHRTSPNSTQRDNFSTKGNINPYTGKRGTKKATH